MPAAALDLDELVEVVAGEDWALVNDSDRRLSWRLANAMVERLISEGINLVAVAGSTLSAEEATEALRGMEGRAAIVSVLLRVPLEEAVRRATQDTLRGSTWEPDVVKRLHDAVDWARAGHADVEIDTKLFSADELAIVVWQAVMSRLG